jgi:hypothetical protein
MVDGAFLLESMWLPAASEGFILALGSAIGCVFAVCLLFAAYMRLLYGFCRLDAAGKWSRPG